MKTSKRSKNKLVFVDHNGDYFHEMFSGWSDEELIPQNEKYGKFNDLMEMGWKIVSVTDAVARDKNDKRGCWVVIEK